MTQDARTGGDMKDVGCNHDWKEVGRFLDTRVKIPRMQTVWRCFRCGEERVEWATFGMVPKGGKG